MTTSSPSAEVKGVAERMTAMLREKPVQFMDLVRAFPDVPYRTLLLAWGEVREEGRTPSRRRGAAPRTIT